MHQIPSPFDAPVLKGGPGSGNRGHAGRPGQRGGSAPGGGKTAGQEGRLPPSKISPEAKVSLEAAAHAAIDRVAKSHNLQPEQVKASFTDGSSGSTIEALGKEMKGNFRETMLKNGLATEPELNRWESMKNDWNFSSDYATSDALEYIMADETGGTVYSNRPSEKEKYPNGSRDVTNDAEFRADTFAKAENITGMNESRLRFLAAHESAYQQTMLRRVFGDKMTIYRGAFRGPEASSATTYIRTNGISSFSANKQIGDDFGGMNGKHYQTEVPVDRVFSSGIGGFGTRSESEIVLKGGVYHVHDLKFNKGDAPAADEIWDIDADPRNRHWLKAGVVKKVVVVKSDAELALEQYRAELIAQLEAPITERY